MNELISGLNHSFNSFGIALGEPSCSGSNMVFTPASATTTQLSTTWQENAGYSRGDWTSREGCVDFYMASPEDPSTLGWAHSVCMPGP